MGQVLFSIYWILNNFAHTIFSLKYWVLSRRMEQACSQATPENEELKVKCIFGGQSALILLCASFLLWCSIDYWTHKVFVDLAQTIAISPAVVETCLLAIALLTISKLEVKERTLELNRG